MPVFRNLIKLVKSKRGDLLSCFLNNKSFSIISDNCWGGFVYQYFNLPYKTPFIGLFVFSPDYIILLSNLKFYLDSDLKFISHEDSKYKKQLKEHGTFGKYPIATLGGEVEIHFLHYGSQSEAREKWNKRVDRVDYDNLIIKFCDRDMCNEKIIEKFFSLTFERKIFLSSKFRSNRVNLKLKGENGLEVCNEWPNFKRTRNLLFFINRFYNS